METINKTDGNYTLAKLTDYRQVYVTKSQSNCKLTVWDHIENGLDIDEVGKDKAIEFVHELLSISQCLVHVHVTEVSLKNFFVKNFDVYNVVKIPCGYYGGYQWHIFLRNTEGDRAEHARPSTYKKRKQLTPA